MNLNEKFQAMQEQFVGLDIKQFYNWPLAPKFLSIATVTAVALVTSWVMVWSPLDDDYKLKLSKEAELKQLEIEKAAAVERAKREWEQANEADKEHLRKRLERTQLELEVAQDKTAELQKEIEGQPTIAQLKSSGHVHIITNYVS